MLYNGSIDLDIQRARTRLEYLISKGKVFELKAVEKRSRKQNSYLHLILGWFACEYHDTLEYVKENYYKRLCNKDLFISIEDDPFCGKVERVRSSSELTTEEMTLSIERFRNWSSAEAGIYLPSSDEQGLLDMIAVEMNKKEVYI